MWQYHDSKMRELKKIYTRINKQTQNRLQEIFDSIDFDFNNLYSIANNKTRKRIHAYIEEWKDKGLLTGYFGMLAINIFKKTRVKNSEILELLIYSAYIEEQNKIQESELNILKDVVNYYYQQGQEEVNNTLPKNKRKTVSVIPDAIFLALLDTPNAKGYVWEQYIQAMMKYNAEQIYRQATIDLQQQKELDITNDIYQNIIKRQNNSKLNINEEKISGDIDLTLIGINNQAKLKGISSVDNDAKVVFLSNLDGTETPMCHSLNNQEFYINRENVFDRYYGDTPKTLSIQRIKCFGLVPGLNLPPVNHHFHWCRSIVQYIPNKNIKLTQNKSYNLLDSIYNNKIEKYNFDSLNIEHIDKKVLSNVLDNMEKVYKDFPQIKGKIKQIKEINHPNAGMSVQPQEDGTYIMEVNKKFFNKEKVIKEIYKKDRESRYHPKNSTYKDIGIHESGHMVLSEILKKKYTDTNLIATDWNSNVTAQRIINKAFDKLKINGIIQRKEAIRNISTHASKYNSNETIAEAFVDYYANKSRATDLSKTIIDIMKGMI